MKIVIFITGIIINLVIFFIDLVILGPDITFTLVYLIPIVMVCWYSGMYRAVMVSIASAVEWAVIQLYYGLHGHGYIILGFNITTKIIMYLFIVFILSKLRNELVSEKKAARKDHLTGAYNRKGLYEHLEIALSRMRQDNQQLTLAYLDIDDFKSIDDKFGHDVGDEMLMVLTATIARNLRKSDIIARFGGDEFVILLPGMDIHDAERVIEKIRSEIRRNMANHGWDSSVSIGAGVFRKWNGSMDEMIRTVDQSMYNIKKGSKNGVEFSIHQ